MRNPGMHLQAAMLILRWAISSTPKEFERATAIILAGPAYSPQDCNICDFWRGLSNRKYQGVRIPGGGGKCCRPEGHCHPERRRGLYGSN